VAPTTLHSVFLAGFSTQVLSIFHQSPSTRSATLRPNSAPLLIAGVGARPDEHFSSTDRLAFVGSRPTFLFGRSSAALPCSRHGLAADVDHVASPVRLVGVIYRSVGQFNFFDAELAPVTFRVLSLVFARLAIEPIVASLRAHVLAGPRHPLPVCFGIESCPTPKILVDVGHDYTAVCSCGVRSPLADAFVIGKVPPNKTISPLDYEANPFFAYYCRRL